MSKAKLGDAGIGGATEARYNYYERQIDCPAGKTCKVSADGNVYVLYPATKINANSAGKGYYPLTSADPDNECFAICDKEPLCQSAIRQHNTECHLKSVKASTNGESTGISW